MDLAEGAVVAGRYRAQYRVGVGGMGEVWAGEHLFVGVRVALKALLPAVAVSHELVTRFRREAFLLGRIRSDYVARVLDFVSDENYGLVLVMEFVEGESLSHVLQLRPLSLEETIGLGVDVVSALCDLHRAKVVHRDLKPGNIILQPLSGGRHRAVIVDFGISRLLSSDDEETITGITRANMALGTVEYMAPEQIISSRDVTAASDLYAVGAMLYRAVAGQHAFGRTEGDELAHRKLVEDAPRLRTGRADRAARGLETLVARALRRRPADRYESAEEMLADLAVLRDLARVSDIDTDATTTFNRTRDLRAMLESGPPPSVSTVDERWPPAELSPVPSAPQAALMRTIQLEDGPRPGPPPAAPPPPSSPGLPIGSVLPMGPALLGPGPASTPVPVAPSSSPGRVESAPRSGPSHPLPSSPGVESGPRPSAPSAPRLSPLPMVAEAPLRSGRVVSLGAAGAFVAVALAGGALLGGTLMHRADRPAASAEALPTCRPGPSESPAATESSVSAAREPSPIDLGEIDDLPESEPSRAKHPAAGSEPIRPAAAGSASASARAARPNAPPVDKIEF